MDQEGKFEAEGKFTLKRSSKLSLNGMILAPQGKYKKWMIIPGILI